MELTEEQRKKVEEDLRTMWRDYEDGNKNVSDELDILQTKVDELPAFVEEMNKRFEEVTSIKNKKDIIFLIVATALQITRQLVIDQYKNRPTDQEAANSTLWHNNDETSNRHRRYYATIEEMETNPVPFDCFRKEAGIAGDPKRNPSLSGFNHRYKALGHDPVLGLIFGTANTMTNTVTVANGGLSLSTYHVHTGIGHRLDTTFPIDKIDAKASTALMFEKVAERIKAEGITPLAVALKKTIIHQLSDVTTKQSLPIPFLEYISPNLARLSSKIGIDQLNLKLFAKEAGLAMLINTIIKTVHTWAYDEKTDVSLELYEARTVKILYYSNLFATGSNLLIAFVRAAMGDERAFNKIDFGGTVVTFYHLLNDPITIAKIQEEFLLTNIEKHFEL
jgi:hypothetical protein